MSAPAGCTRPESGSALDAYLDGTLSGAERDAYEAHYFECPACLETIGLRQNLGAALEGAGESLRTRSRWPHVWIAAAALAAAAVLAVVLLPSPPSIVLDGTLRGTEQAATAALAGKALDLRLRVPVPDVEGVRYSVRILDPSGDVAFSRDGLFPEAPNEVRVKLPRGLDRTGRYEVVLDEQVPGDPEPMRHRFTLDIVEAE